MGRPRGGACVDFEMGGDGQERVKHSTLLREDVNRLQVREEDGKR